MANKRDRKSTSNLVGQQLGDYVLTGKLATGGMAHIYKGVDDRLERQAAIKVLTPDLLEADASLTERFKREARAIAALEHENIITIYQYGEHEGIYFLAMKYVPGMDLADELNRLRRTGEQMEINRALRILEQVASALDYAHRAGIIHRDVKPSNILLDQNDKAILTDFGLVLRQSVDQTMGTAFGTPRYISPEQAIASEDAVSQSDIYSLAVVLYEILTGQSVFHASTPMEMALSHIHNPPPPPRTVNPDIPPAVEVEILKALSKEPSARHQTALELIHAVKQAYGLPIEKEPVSPSVGYVPPTQIPPSKTPVLIEYSTDKPLPEPTPPVSKKPPTHRAALLASVILVIVTVGGYLVFMPMIRQNQSEENLVIPTEFVVAANTQETEAANTPMPTFTPSAEPAESTPAQAETSEPVVVPTGTGPTNSAIVMVYSYEALVIRNESDFALDLRDFKLVRGADDETDDFYGSVVTERTLPVGKCILIRVEGRQFDAPADWQCNSQQLYYLVTRAPALLFWRVSGQTDAFQVYLNDTIIETCPAVARGQNNTCVVSWTAIAQGAAG